MTTKLAEEHYLAKHLHENENKGYAVYNPNGFPLNELPVIFGFNNGGSRNWLSAQLIAEDGTALGSHTCSHEGYMPNDLGILEGTREDRHEKFKKHYPQGYRMDFVNYENALTHQGLLKALANNKRIRERETLNDK